MTLQQTDRLLFTGCLTAACLWNNVVKELSLTCSFSCCLWHFCAPRTKLRRCRGDTIWGRKRKVLLSGL